MLRYHHAHSQTCNFISVIFICKYAAPPTEHLRDCGPQNSQVFLFPISGEIFQHFSSFGSTMKKGEREFYRLSLYMPNEVLFTSLTATKKDEVQQCGIISLNFTF